MGQRKCLFPNLLGEIIKVCGSQAAFAVQLGISAATLSAKMNKKREWSTDEMEKTCEILHVPISMIPRLFFNAESREYLDTEV